MSAIPPALAPIPDVDRVIDIMKDAAYVTIGFGVLTFQRAQVRRQELKKVASQRIGSLDARYEALESRLDEVVGVVGQRLGDPAGDVLEQAHRAARAARRQVASRLIPTS